MSDSGLAPILENLAENAASAARECEKRVGHLSELAYAVAERLAAAGEATSPFAFFPAAATLLAGLLPFTDADRAHLARCLQKEAEARLGRALTLFDFAEGAVLPPDRSRTAFVENPYALEAYRRFGAHLTLPTPLVRNSLRELLDDVENGYAEYAVLPLLSGGVRISSVSRMIEEYGHAIVAVTTVKTSDGEAVFALLARRPVRLAPPTLGSVVSSYGAVGLAGLLTALPLLGLTLAHVDPLPPSPGGPTALYSVTVRGEEAALTSLLVYLSLFVPGYLGGGFYTEID